MRRNIPFAALLVFCVGLLPGAVPVATATFTGGEQGRILIEAMINGKGPYPFIFDTGSVNILSLELAKKLGAPVSGTKQMAAFGGSVETGATILESITVGDLVLSRSEILVIDGGPFTKGGPVGFLGWELLQKLVIEVDYQYGRLNFYDPATYTYSGKAVRIPVTTNGNMIAIPAQVYGHVASLELDSGNESSALVLFRKFTAENKLHSDLEAITGYGFGGLTRAMVARAPALSIGGMEIRAPLVHMSLEKSGLEGGSLDGNIGAPILREFTCIYDLPHQAIYLEPDIWFNKSELDDHSGVVLDTRRGTAEVLYVYPRSPAAEAGITAGDQLSMEGREVTDYQWHDSLNAPPGAVVHLLVVHNGKNREVSLTLRDYL